MSWVRRAYVLFELMHRRQRELERKDLVMRLEMPEQTASNVISRLRAAECIAYAYGSKRTGVFYRFIPDSKMPSDRRGRSEGSRDALRARAARPPTSVARWKVEEADA